MVCIARQDQHAFSQLIDRHLTKGVRFCTRMVGMQDVAEDIVQEAFMKIWKHAAVWRAEAKFTTWFFAVLHNAALNVIRRRGVRKEHVLEDVHESSDMPQDQHYIRQEKARLVQAALEELPERQKTAIILSYYEELSQKEAAAVLGVSEGALESLLTRARKNLEELLRQRL